MNLFSRRKTLMIASLLVAFSGQAHAAPLGESEAPSSHDVTVLEESGNATDMTILPEEKPEEKRARIADRRRQSEERLLGLLREVGGDVPLLRESLRDFLREEARARRPLRNQSRRLMAALHLGVSPDNATRPNQAIQKLRAAIGLSPDAAPNSFAARKQKTADAAQRTGNATNLDSELRFSLRQQKPDAAASTEDETRSDARVLAAQTDKELRALVEQLRELQASERERRTAREAELDAKLHFRDNPRLEAALLLLGIIGDSGYTISIQMLPASHATTPPQDAASTRELEQTPNIAAPTQKSP